MKSQDDRLLQTKSWIASRAPMSEQANVRQELDLWTTAFAQQAQGLSTVMHIGREGTEDERALRRGSMLLAAMLGGTAARIAQMRTTGVPALRMEFTRLLYRLRLVADQKRPTVHLIRRIFESELQANPAGFLQDNKLKINGATAVKGQDNVLPFHFYFDALADRFEIAKDAAPADRPGGHGFNAVSIPAVDWKLVPGRTANPIQGSFAGIAGTRLLGSSIVVTTQFTGCALCLKDAGGQLFAAHVSPSDLKEAGNDTRSPTVLAEQLTGKNPNVAAGNFANAAGAGTFHVYGAGHSNIPGLAAGYPLRKDNSDMMTIIGFKDAEWHLYSQHIVSGRVAKVVTVY